MMMKRVRVNVRGVDEAIWERMRIIRFEEQICLGRLVTEALEAYTEDYFADGGEEPTEAA